MTQRQQTLDFTRAEQLAILRNAVLPASVQTRRGGVSGVTLKAVLRAIDDHGKRCYAKQATLAAEVGCSPETIKRSVEALQTLSLICVERRQTPLGTVGNHYTIVWSEIAVRAQRRPDQSVMMTPDRSVMVRDQSVMVRDQSVMDDTCNRKRKEAQKEPPPPTPSRAAIPEPAPGSDGGGGSFVDWSMAETRLRKLKVGDARAAVEAARAKGYDLDGVKAIADVWESRRPAWGPGALHWRLANGSPEQAPTDGWPPPEVVTPEPEPSAGLPPEVAAFARVLAARRAGRATHA